MKNYELINQRKAGAILSYISLIVNAIIAFIYVPLLLEFLTTNEYGVYELIGSIIAYFSVMDMGLSTTLNRFYVKAKVSEGEKSVENLLAMAAIIYGILTAMAVVAGFVFNVAMDSLFAGSFTTAELKLAHQMMMLVILNCAIVLPGNWFLALINANERFVFARSLSIVKYLLNVIGILAILSWQSSALWVLSVQVFMNLLAVLSYVAYCKGKLGIKSKLHHWDWNLLGSLLAFSLFILLNMIFDQIFWKTGQVVLGAVCGTAEVAIYGITCKLITSAYMQVSTGVTSVFLPKLTAISARTEDMTEINKLFNRIGRIQAMLVWGVCAAFIAMGAEFIYLWAGSDFSDAYPATVILMLGLSVSLVQNLGLSVLQVKNKMGFRSIVYIVLAILDVVISIPVSANFGVIGCAVVASVLLFVGTGPVINFYYHKAIGIDIPSFYRQVIPLMVPAAIAALACWGSFSFLFNEWSWTIFAVESMVFVVVYIGLLWAVWFNEYEKGLFASILRKLHIIRG